MESKYDIENFENFLKERSDSFRMYPSKRVWYSIYNNIHPSKLMPSISMSVFLFFSILYIGFYNTKSGFQTNTIQPNNAITSIASPKINFDLKNTANDFQIKLSDGTSSIINFDLISSTSEQQNLNRHFDLSALIHSGFFADPMQSGTSTKLNISSTLKVNRTTKSVFNIANATAANFEEDKVSATNFETELITKPTINKISENQIALIGINPTANNIDANKQTEIIETYFTEQHPAIQNLESVKNENVSQENKLEKINSLNTSANKTAITDSEKSWIEHYAMYYKTAAPKWKGKLSWQAYITPSIVYRNILNNAAGKNLGVNTAFSGNYNNADVQHSVSHLPSFGIEAGAGLQYSILKNLKIKTGLQFNFTRYTINAFENYHPIATSLTLNNSLNENVYEVYRTTPFSNNTGLSPVRLHNQTYQISIPIGVDIKLAKFENFDWYAGATIQPTIIVTANSYLISSDRRNYINENKMLNRLNLNAGFETYISYKSNSYTWQIGPQFRSQIFSTNSKVYSVEERLQNFGLKIGISKKL